MNLIEYFPKLVDKKVPISALKIPPRVFLNWKKEGVIDLLDEDLIEDNNKPNRKTNRKWVYLNAFDALWLMIVKELRKFNLDLKTIVKLKKYLFDLDEINKIIQNANEKEIKEFAEKYYSDDLVKDSEIQHYQFDRVLKDFEFLSSNDYKNFINRIGNIFFSVLVLKQPVSIILYRIPDSDEIQFEVFDKNMLAKTISNEFLFDYMSKRFDTEYFINIPVISLFTKLFEDEDFEKYTSSFDLFTHREQKVLELLRNDNYKQIIIKKGDDGFIHLESKSSLEYKNETAKEIRKVLGLKTYERIDVIQRNDKHLIINKTTKEKL